MRTPRGPQCSLCSGETPEASPAILVPLTGADSSVLRRDSLGAHS